MSALTLARLQGTANLMGGLWPLLHLKSFEAVFGPKTDRWLVKTVSGLLVVNGLTQLGPRSVPATFEAGTAGSKLHTRPGGESWPESSPPAATRRGDLI
jgi:hypothetical protein